MELSGLLLSRLLDPLAGIGIQAAIDPVTIDPVGLAEFPAAATTGAVATTTILLGLLLAVLLAMLGTDVGLGHGGHQLLRGPAVHGCHWLAGVADEVELIRQCCHVPWPLGPIPTCPVGIKLT